MNEITGLNCSRRFWLQSAIIAGSLPLTAWGRTPMPDDEEEEEESDDKKYKTKLNTPLIGDYVNFSGLDPVVLEGVGIVRGLSGTGGDPSPSQYRSILMDDLKKQGYKNPNAILQSPDTALVIVHAYLRPLVKKGDRLDVEVIIPESANATSLVGGELMEVRLSDKAVVDGKIMAGRVYAVARGPILTAGLGASANKVPALLRKGSVLGGAVVSKERELSLFLKNDVRAIRNANRVALSIGERFHGFDEHGIKESLAKAKTDQRIVLKVEKKYRDNWPRYLQVIRHLAFHETPVNRRVRMNFLKHDLSIPETASSSALQLEAIGKDAIPILKSGLNAPTLECRFHSAVSLAYLGDSTGLPVLVESVVKERAFRVFALAALSVFEDPEAHLVLREIMNEPNDETRYGAFRALWTLDKNDPFIRGEILGRREDAENADNEYKLHVLKTSGPPLVHVTLRTRPEIVVFGAEQEFSAPMYASAGKHIIVTAQPGATTIVLSRFEVGKPDMRKEVSMRVADVILAADELGATYPDLLQMLADASRQKNLPTALAVDKLPEAGRAYYRPASNGPSTGPRGIKIGRDNYSPNIFPEADDPDKAARRAEEEERARIFGGGEGAMGNVPADSPATPSDSDSESKSVKAKGRSKKKNEKPEKPKRSWSWFGGNQ